MPYVYNGSVRIHYTVDGVGPSLVLQHGFTGSSQDLREFGFVDALRDRCQLIMPDARGHGCSDKPSDPAAYGAANLAADVLAVLDDLGVEQAHYYGYSYGGMLGYVLGTSAPERFASLAIGGAHPYQPGRDVLDRLDRVQHYLGQGMDAYVAWRERQSGTLTQGFRERMLANDPQALAAFVCAGNAPLPDDFDAQAARMTMPVLVLSGDDDELHAGSLARRAAGKLPNACFVEIANADHLTLYLRSDLILPHLTAFLDRMGLEATAARPQPDSARG